MTSIPAPAYLQHVGTAVPRHAVHEALLAYARSRLRSGPERELLDRVARRSGIAQRYAVLPPGRVEAGEIDAAGFYRPGAFPTTAVRMALFERQALPLALHAVQALAPPDELAALLARVTHLVVGTSSGFMAPGLDVQLVDALALPGSVRRTLIGFMGGAAGLVGLRLASDAVRADDQAQVLLVNVELGSLHLRESHRLPDLLPFLLVGDGASAALVGSEPRGAELLGFHTALLPDSRDLLCGSVGDNGFEMRFSPLVPGRVAEALLASRAADGTTSLLGPDPLPARGAWAVHAGSATVLDAVQRSLVLPPAALRASRQVLHDVGNLSSASVLFALRHILAESRPGEPGLALALGPGLTAESMRFRMAGLS